MSFNCIFRNGWKKSRMKNDKKIKRIGILNSRLIVCNECRLSLTRKNVLLGEGSTDSHLMIIALSPGKMEDLGNHMFIGPSGQILNKMFKGAGIERPSVYMTNLIKCMLPKNRRPKMDEIESCSQFLNEEIDIIGPEAIIPLGYYATRYILNKYNADPPAARVDLARLYGELIFSDEQKILPLPHPASILYDPSLEAETIEKYKKIQILTGRDQE